MQDKRQRTLKIISISAVLLGVISAGISLFIRMINRMDTAWFINTYGPNSSQSHGAYDTLYNHSLVIIKAANRYMVGFYISLTVGFLLLGVICGLWSKDIRKMNHINRCQ